MIILWSRAEEGPHENGTNLRKLCEQGSWIKSLLGVFRENRMDMSSRMIQSSARIAEYSSMTIDRCVDIERRLSS